MVQRKVQWNSKSHCTSTDAVELKEKSEISWFNRSQCNLRLLRLQYAVFIAWVKHCYRRKRSNMQAAVRDKFCTNFSFADGVGAFRQSDHLYEVECHGEMCIYRNRFAVNGRRRDGTEIGSYIETKLRNLWNSCKEKWHVVGIGSWHRQVKTHNKAVLLKESSWINGNRERFNVHHSWEWCD